MAHSTLTVFEALESHSSFIDSLIARVDEILPAPSLCYYESPESAWLACDGGIPCTAIATVHELATGAEYCAKHFREVR